MKFDQKYPEVKLSIEQQMHPQTTTLTKVPANGGTLIYTGRVYPCDICRTPTPWRLVNGVEVPVCSEECLQELENRMIEIPIPNVNCYMQIEDVEVLDG